MKPARVPTVAAFVAIVVTALLGPDGTHLSDEELDRIAALIAAARKEPR